MHVAVEHDLSPEETKAAVEKAFAHYRDRYGKYKPTLRWLDAGHARAEVSFNAKGVIVRGSVRFEPGKIVMDAKVPLLLRPFTRKAVSVVESELGKWLGGRGHMMHR